MHGNVHIPLKDLNMITYNVMVMFGSCCFGRNHTSVSVLASKSSSISTATIFIYAYIVISSIVSAIIPEWKIHIFE